MLKGRVRWVRLPAQPAIRRAASLSETARLADRPRVGAQAHDRVIDERDAFAGALRSREAG